MLVAVALVEAWLACWATLEAAARPCPRAAGAPPWPATLAALVVDLTYVLGTAGGYHLALLDSGGTAVARRRHATPVVSVGIVVTCGRLTALADGEAAWESARVPSVRVLGVKCVK